ncbi:hypothetical protein SAMN05444161_8776 [Rhizobiales bacterium GAS191]|nr:hypothetical protein SAMN05444161_8776 [Rhizobiales bacterium GAS191]
MSQEPDNSGIPEERLQYIYDAYRTALLNRKYFAIMLSRYRSLNTGAEILIAIGGAGSAGIAGLAIFGTLPGKYVWLLVSAAAAVLSVIKPVLKFGDKIENYTKLFANQSIIYFELKDIVEDIRVSRLFTAAVQKKYDSTKKLVKELGAKEYVGRNDHLTQKLQHEVNEEIRADELWIPPAPSPPHAPAAPATGPGRLKRTAILPR